MNHMDSDLYLALVKDNIGVLKSKDWLNKVVRDQLTPANNTVLHLACQYGSIRCVEEILSAHESLLLETNSRGETALHLAARQGHYGAVEALINKAKSMVPQPNNILEMPSSSTVLQNLIRAPNVELETALHAAVRYNHEKVVEVLVKEDPSYAYPQNKYNETPLYLAAVRCYSGVTKVILDNCESPTFGGPNGTTALHAAVVRSGIKEDECMKLLLTKNKDLIKQVDSKGWTAFHYMANDDWWSDSIRYLLNVDKSVAYLADKKYKRTALHVAAYKGHHCVIRTLLENLPDAWESVDGNGQNILHIAVMQDHKFLIGYILSGRILKFDMKNTLFIQRDNEGNTPLHLIAKFGCYFPELQNTDDWNADWDVVDNKNFTPRDVFHQKQTGTVIDEELGGEALDRTRYTWEKWIKDKVPSDEDEDADKERKKWHREMVNTHMLVAALITTVALTAGFAMPGGFDGNQGPNQGSAVLSRKTAFKIFLVADTIALLFSISSLFLYFLTPMINKKRVVDFLVTTSVVLNIVSITAMMLAFIAGTSAVLSHSSGLTISVCIISSLFLLLVFYVCFTACRRARKARKANKDS